MPPRRSLSCFDAEGWGIFRTMRQRRRRKPVMMFHVGHSFQEAEEWNIKFWRRVGARGRFEAAWSLIGDYFKMRGKHGRVPRLRRDVLRIERL